MDAEGLDLLRQRLGQPLERPLRRVVDADILKRGASAFRRHLEDVPAALGAQVRQRCPLPASAWYGGLRSVTQSAPNRLVWSGSRASCSVSSSGARESP